MEDLYHSENHLKPELFMDNAHLNNDGAQLFTQYLIAKLREDNYILFDVKEFEKKMRLTEIFKEVESNNAICALLYSLFQKHNS